MPSRRPDNEKEALLQGTRTCLPLSTPRCSHELAHEILHHQPRRAATSKTVRETEAEAVAFVVCQPSASKPDRPRRITFQLHRGDAKLLLESLNYIRLAAGRILGGILENQTLPEPTGGLDSASQRTYFFGGVRRRMASSSNA